MPMSDSLDHEDIVVDCGYTRVIACRVGDLGTSLVRAARPGEFTRLIRDRHPHDDSSAFVPHIYVSRLLRAKLREFTLKELEKATLNFSRERMVGQGGFGQVFKGTLSDGASVAVKVLHEDSFQGSEQFQAEMTVSYLIMSTSYTNLVPAIGYHSSHKRKKVKVMIVYPFMVNKDVGRYLNDREPPRSPLNWPTRKRIALGLARGVSSLHELGIIHRDINPSNVMLDEDFNAHVGDLGLAKSFGLPQDSYKAAEVNVDVDSPNYITTAVAGTSGFLAPEYLMWGRCSRESDVYSFGVTLIQLVTGIPAVDMTDIRGNIACRAEQLLKNKEELTRHIHPDMLGMHDESEAIELIRLGLVCVQDRSHKRPLMPEVIAIMEGSGTALDKRWDNYNMAGSGTALDNGWDTYDSASSDLLLPAYSQSKTGSDISSPPTSVSFVGTDGNERGDDDEEAYEENDEIGNQLRQAVDFQPEESNKEQPVGDAWDRHRGHQSPVSCSNPALPIDASISVAESTSQDNARSLENDTEPEIIGADQTERGNSLHRSSRENRQERQPDKVTTKHKELLDQRREMELNHQAAMEEMHQKKIEIMQSMIKMQEEYIQKVNQMQSQIDQLKEEEM